MTLIQYKEFNFKQATLVTIAHANRMIADYQSQGYEMTLRQMYYQFVSEALIENTMRNYKTLGKVISNARLGGLISWDAIEDRHRECKFHYSEESIASALRLTYRSYRLNPWEQQQTYVEVWVEKAALINVVERAARLWRVPYMACIGYMSQSEQHEAAMRFTEKFEEGKEVIVLHLGDH